MTITGAASVVRHLEAQGVTHVFGVPGAKIDRGYDALLDSSISTVVCRHEQNAWVKSNKGTKSSTRILSFYHKSG